MRGNDVGAKRDLCDWLEAAIADRDTVHLPTLTDEAVAAFQGNEEFLARWLRETFRPVVYELAQRVVSQSRGQRIYLSGTDSVSDRKAVRGAIKAAAKWQRWLEHTGSGHVRLMVMNRPQLLEAAAERERRGATEYLLAHLFRALALRLPNDTAPLEEVLTPEDIEELAQAMDPPALAAD